MTQPLTSDDRINNQKNLTLKVSKKKASKRDSKTYTFGFKKLTTKAQD
jgi:hypothetical protein